MRVWHFDGRLITILKGHEGAINSLVLGPSSDRVISGSDDGTIRVWDLKAGTELRKLNGSVNRAVRQIATSSDGRFVAGLYQRTAVCWDLATGELAAFTLETDPMCVALAGDRTLLVGDRGGRVHCLALKV